MQSYKAVICRYFREWALYGIKPVPMH